MLYSIVISSAISSNDEDFFLPKVTGELIGYIVRTKDNVKPLFVSPGHLITAEASVQIVLGCHKGYRLPEPTRLAHLEVNKIRIRFLKEHNDNKVGVN